MTQREELGNLLEDAATQVDAWTDNEQWTFEPGSPAALEAANSEVRLDGSPWGDRPVRSAYFLGQMATKFTVEMARCLVPLIRDGRPAPGIETLTRTSLESASVVWWLFEPGINARQRVCRMQLLRRNNAKEMEKATKAVGGNPSLNTHESVTAVETYGQALGLPAFGNKGEELEGETRLRYTERVKSFTDDVGHRGAYNIYSGVAHAELSGLWRLFQKSGTQPENQEPKYSAGPDPIATFSAAYGALKAMQGSMSRISLLFGWATPGRAQQVEAWMRHLDEEMARLERG